MLELAEITGFAEELDPAQFDAVRVGPGKYERADNLGLAVALDIIAQHGFAAESVEIDGHGGSSGYAWRYGRFVGIEDADGFVTAKDYETVKSAVAALEALSGESALSKIGAALVHMADAEVFEVLERTPRGHQLHELVARECAGRMPIAA